LEENLISNNSEHSGDNEADEEEDSDDDAEMPEDLVDLEPAEQQKWLIFRSL